MARRGWRVSLAVNGQDERKRVRIETFAAGVEGITAIGVLPPRTGPWGALARAVRGTMDFVRYLDERYAGARLLRERMRRKALPVWLRWLDRYERLSDRRRLRLLSMLRGIEESIPTFSPLDRLLEAVSPDVLVVSPLVDLVSEQVDIVRSARAAGVPVVAAIASWDNLTNKGLLRTTLDRVLVWNEAQRREAVALHGIPASSVVVTGAQAFDRWFTRRPSRPRQEFCRDVGLPDDRPFVLFTGSSIFISRGPSEIAFVRRWVAAVRASLGDVPILMRPHPYNGAFWTGIELDGYGSVAIWPRGAYDPTDDRNRADYFDSLYHCAAVVGINTSAMVEAAILSKPVLTLRADEFEGTQGGTLHFNHLLPEQGGCVRIAQTMEEHLAQLGEAMAEPQAAAAAAGRFVGSFLRPRGGDRPCVPFFADALLDMPGRRPDAPPAGAARVAAAFALALVVQSLDAAAAAIASVRTATAMREFGRRLEKLRKAANPRRRLRDLRDVVTKQSRRRARVTRAQLREWRGGWSRKRAQSGIERAWKSSTRALRLGRRTLTRAPRRVADGLLRRVRRLSRRRHGADLTAATLSRTRREHRPLTVLFSVRNFWYVKLFDSVIRELAARGHRVHILADVGRDHWRTRGWDDAARRLEAECAGVTCTYMPERSPSPWDILASAFRLTLDYLRFFRREYATAPKLRARAEVRVPPVLRRWLESWPWRTRAGTAMARRLLSHAESCLPDPPELAELLRELRPDLVVISPLVTLGSQQFDLLRASRRLGLRTAFAVGSWDHLSSKALVRIVPDAVLLWNETQRAEAVRLHQLPAKRVVVTGAQCFDAWFERAPSMDAEEFRRRVGLDAARPHVAYVCSALFEGSPSEAEFVLRWIRAVRGSSSLELRECGLLIRPHPKRLFEWDGIDLSPWPNVALWPATGDAPFDEVTKDDYFHSLHHAAAVVGLNTSALIEGAVMGRSVHTVLLPEFVENQEGTLHFRYLLEVGGGLLCASRTLSEHVDRLATAVREQWTAPVAFIERFVRPHGIARAATPIFADAVETVAAAAERRPMREPLTAALVRRVVRPLATQVQGSDRVQRGLRKVEKLRLRSERIAAKARMRDAASRRPAAEPEATGTSRAATEELETSGKYR